MFLIQNLYMTIIVIYKFKTINIKFFVEDNIYIPPIILNIEE